MRQLARDIYCQMSCLGEANEVPCCMSPRGSEAVSGAVRSRGCLGQVSGRESAKNRQRDNVLCLLSTRKSHGLQEKVQGLSHRRKARVLRACQQLRSWL